MVAHHASDAHKITVPTYGGIKDAIDICHCIYRKWALLLASTVRELSRLFGVDGATIARWQALWRDHVPRTSYWNAEDASSRPLTDRCIVSSGAFTLSNGTERS
jgi:hypothetical protein